MNNFIRFIGEYEDEHGKRFTAPMSIEEVVQEIDRNGMYNICIIEREKGQ